MTQPSATRPFPHLQVDDGGGHLGLGQEAVGGHIEEDLRLGVKVTEDGEGGVVGGAGFGGDSLGNLLLHHDCDGVEAFRFQQGGKNGGCDVIGQVGAGHGAQTGEFLGNESLYIGLQHILPDDFKIVKFAHSQVQNGLEPLVQLTGHDLARPQTESLSQRADAGADLQHAGGGIYPRVLGDLPGNPGGDQEILTLCLGKMEAMGSQQGLHDLNVGYVDHILHLMRN